LIQISKPKKEKPVIKLLIRKKKVVKKLRTPQLFENKGTPSFTPQISMIKVLHSEIITEQSLLLFAR